MKKLKFILKSMEDIVIDKELTYKVKNGCFEFFIDRIKYLVKCEENFLFLRETSEEIFKLTNEGGVNKASVFLIKENVEVEIPVISLDYKNMDKTYEIKYNIESDAGSIKTIILEFID